MTRLIAIAPFLALAAGPTLAEDKGPFDVLAYSVSLSVDPVTRSVAGEEIIRLRLREPAREVTFSDNALEIVRAPAPVRREGGRLVFALPHAGQSGEAFVLRIAYRGQPRRGLHFEPGLVYTSYFACDWMVCDQDRPGDKARFDLRLDLPRDFRAVEGRATRRPYSAFLYGFAGGTLNEARLGRGLRAFSASRTPSELQALFAPTADMVAFFEHKAGLRLPSSDYWQLQTTASEAQEGSDFAIIGDDMISPIRETPQEDWVIAHELSHQWWGDLITCDSWSEVWLNEGFAVFMTAAWKEHRWGRAAYDREMELARRRLAASAAAGYDKPLTWTGAYPSLSIRRGVVYSKGALFLDALRTRLGEEAFWRAIRIYTRRHAGGTVVSGDFQAAVEAAAPGKSGDLFRTWVFAGA